MAQRGKNGQFKRKTNRRTRRAMPSSSPRRSRGKAPLSLLKVAETAVMADQVTKGLFNIDLRSFVMNESAGTTSGTKYTQITLRELLSGATGGSYGTDYVATVGGRKGTYGNSFGEQIKANLKANGAQMAFNVIAIPFAFKFGKRALGKPLINPTNRIIRNTLGIKEVKV